MIGADVLDDLAVFLTRFVRLPSPAAEVAVVLWVAHAHTLEAAEATPYLSVQSPEKRSGKTRLLEVLELVVPRPLRASAASESALFRSIAEDPPPTLLFDEIDAIFTRPRAETEGLRGLLNAGHRRGSVVIRSVVKGKAVEVERLPVFSAKVLAGIGQPPDTIADRSIVIRMRRRARGEAIEKFRYRLVVVEGQEQRDRVAAWAAEALDALNPDPDVPPELDDRAADGWEPLLSLADAAGGSWPARARAAAVALSAGRDDEDGDSLGVRLLADCRLIFDELHVDRISSRDLVGGLVALEMAPWGDLRGNPITQRILGRMLRAYDVVSKALRLPDGTNLKGYERGQFADAWARYCAPCEDAEIGETRPSPALQASHRHIGVVKPISAHSQASQNGTCDASEKPENTSSHVGCDVVTDGTPAIGNAEEDWRDLLPHDASRDDGVGGAA